VPLHACALASHPASGFVTHFAPPLFSTQLAWMSAQSWKLTSPLRSHPSLMFPSQRSLPFGSHDVGARSVHPVDEASSHVA
jgi:hypothetical protein